MCAGGREEGVEGGRVRSFDVEVDREGVRKWEGEEWPVNTLHQRCI